VLELTREGLDAGPAPETTLFDALIPLLEQVGARFERGAFSCRRCSARARP
jgi:methanogenic corrinoid protein MtbC1